MEKDYCCERFCALSMSIDDDGSDVGAGVVAIPSAGTGD